MTIQQPGDLVLTHSRGVHQGFNLGGNINVSCNWADDKWEGLVDEKRVLLCECGDELEEELNDASMASIDWALKCRSHNGGGMLLIPYGDHSLF
jgi:hypothetical protein